MLKKTVALPIISKADLHVHSKYSSFAAKDKRIPNIAKRIIKYESFTEPEDIYTMAKAKGMNFVTITDHNTIDGCFDLMANHPDDTFISTELTVRFTDTFRTPVHLLLYNIKPHQFNEVRYLSGNIKDVRDYIRSCPNIVHSVAHPFKSVDRISRYLTHMMQREDIIEQLLVLFDNFEVRNERARHIKNDLCYDALAYLDINMIYRLSNKYDIEPYSKTSGMKGVTGGTDDHCGLHIAETYTYSMLPVSNYRSFLNSIDLNHSDIGGNDGNMIINFDGYMHLVVDNISIRDPLLLKKRL